MPHERDAKTFLNQGSFRQSKLLLVNYMPDTGQKTGIVGTKQNTEVCQCNRFSRDIREMLHKI